MLDGVSKRKSEKAKKRLGKSLTNKTGSAIINT